MATYRLIWCEDCIDSWTADKPFRCDDGDAAPACPICGGDDTAPSGIPDDEED